MKVIDIGRIIVKTAGRESGQKAVIVDLIDQNFALVTGGQYSKVKRRKANIKHLEPTEHKVDIKKNADDKAVDEAIVDAGLVEFIEEKVL